MERHRGSTLPTFVRGPSLPVATLVDYVMTCQTVLISDKRREREGEKHYLARRISYPHVLNWVIKRGKQVQLLRVIPQMYGIKILVSNVGPTPTTCDHKSAILNVSTLPLWHNEICWCILSTTANPIQRLDLPAHRQIPVTRNREYLCYWFQLPCITLR